MDNKNNEVSFALAKVTTEQFATFEDNFCPDSDIQLKLDFRFNASIENHLVGVFAAFTFACNEKPFMTIEAGCHFEINTESWENLFDSESKQLTIPKGMIQHLAVITVGTARGILHAKTENTKFNQFHLPTVNLAEIITEDQVFELTDNNN
ncbi:hypothetical protein [Carboxylicivirga taeanensis]|uniref:hypothetical protein n=1 Tax=Carboxylicivirga taeanensis TaxID=1416875 RepID=UPI003F6DF7E7